MENCLIDVKQIDFDRENFRSLKVNGARRNVFWNNQQ